MGPLTASGVRGVVSDLVVYFLRLLWRCLYRPKIRTVVIEDFPSYRKMPGTTPALGSLALLLTKQLVYHASAVPWRDPMPLLLPLIHNRKLFHTPQLLLPRQRVEPVVVAVALVDIQAAAQRDSPAGISDDGTVMPCVAEFVG